MQIHSDASTYVAGIYERLKQKLTDHLDDYITEPSSEKKRIPCIVNAHSVRFNIENSPIFVPGKIIRENLRGFVIAHGETCLVTERR